MCEEGNVVFTGALWASACVFTSVCLCAQTEFPEWKGFGCSSPAFKGGQTESSSPELHKPNLLLKMSVSRARAGRLLPDRLTGQVKSPRLNLRGAVRTPVRCCYSQFFNHSAYFEYKNEMELLLFLALRGTVLVCKALECLCRLGPRKLG